MRTTVWVLSCNNRFNIQTKNIGIFYDAADAYKAARKHKSTLESPEMVFYYIQLFDIDKESLMCEDSHVLDV
jgi:hypothetical protein